MMIPPLMMSLLLKTMIGLWHHAGPELCVRFCGSSGGARGPLTPHILVGLPSASNGVRFLLNFLPPIYGSIGITSDNHRNADIPPLVGLLNLPARPLLPGGILVVTSVMY